MKEVKAQLRFLRIAPRKVRVVADTIKGKAVTVADTQLKFLEKTAALPVRKLLRSAIANAKHNFNLNADQLMVKNIRVDKGPTLKRFMPRARGMASPIHKHMSHIMLVLGEQKESKDKNK